MAVYGEEARWHSKWSKVHLFVQIVNSLVWIYNTGCSAPFSLGRSYRPPPRTSSLSPVLQHLKFKHLFFNIDKLQLQIQLLHLGCHCLLLLPVTGRKSKDSAITPETTQTHSHTPLNFRATRSLDAELRMLNDAVDVTQKHKLGFRTSQLLLQLLLHLLSVSQEKVKGAVQ